MELHAENPQQNVIAIIPARYASTRLPGKMLLEIAGKPLIMHTLGQAMKARGVLRAIVATDDERIFDVVRGGGGEAVMTDPNHQSGSDRLAEVAKNLPENSIIVNVQGDEPTISPRTIELAVEAFTGGNASVNERAFANLDDERKVNQGMSSSIVHGDLSTCTLVNTRVSARLADIVTTSEPLVNKSELLDSNVVKVVTNEDGFAIYFSRSPIPFPRESAQKYNGDPGRAIEEEPELLSIFRKHTGLYVYRREYLLKFAKMAPTKLEKIEMLEQLRALENGAKIRVVEVNEPSIGVDTADDFERVKMILEV